MQLLNTAFTQRKQSHGIGCEPRPGDARKQVCVEMRFGQQPAPSSSDCVDGCLLIPYILPQESDKEVEDVGNTCTAKGTKILLQLMTTSIIKECISRNGKSIPIFHKAKMKRQMLANGHTFFRVGVSQLRETQRFPSFVFQ